MAFIQGAYIPSGVGVIIFGKLNGLHTWAVYIKGTYIRGRCMYIREAYQQDFTIIFIAPQLFDAVTFFMTLYFGAFELHM